MQPTAKERLLKKLEAKKKELEKLEEKEKRKKEAEEEKRKKEAEDQNEVHEAAGDNQFARQQQEQQMDELHANATKASFEDRNEYFYRDGSKVIDHEDGHMSIVAGRWSTPEDQAKLAIESAQAKGWETVSTKGFDEVTQSYLEAIGKANNIEVKTEAEWAKEVNEQETKQQQYEDELEKADEVEIEATQEQEPLEPLAITNEQQEQTIHEQQRQAEVEAEIE